MKYQHTILFGLLPAFTLIVPSKLGIGNSESEADTNIFLPLALNGANINHMVLVPAGEFQMGCDPDHNGGYSCPTNELPLHTVYLDSYHIAKTEVTNAQYAAFLNTRAINDCNGYECLNLDNRFVHIHYQNKQNVVDAGYEDHPVVEVTWYGSEAYCAENGERLPTEAEWEKAARGTAVQTFPWGDQNADCTLVNYADCVGDTSPVGSYPAGASPYGALNMAGNVWEWVNDWYAINYYNTYPPDGWPDNPPGPGSGPAAFKVLRGGDWHGPDSFLPVANRYYGNPSLGYNLIGFRCAFSVP